MPSPNDPSLQRPPSVAAPQHAVLRREVGLGGAVLMGLGSIVGTGAFVSIALAAGVTGPSVLVAIALAAAVATCNALSSAQLAAALPVSGGSYEYGYHYLRPWLGFVAGWMFLCAKTASAATAARGFAGYLLLACGWQDRRLLELLALAAVVSLTAIVLAGVRRSSWANVMIVSVTLASLALFVLAVAPSAWRSAPEHLRPLMPERIDSLLEATALIFVAYTGYGRIATLGEEVRQPRQTIPRAIVTTLVISALLYLAVGAAGVASVGAAALAEAGQQQAAPLAAIARQLSSPALALLVSIGAITAMLGVLLNLLLGLSRVLLAMGRRGDAPTVFGTLNAARTTPTAAALLIGGLVAAGAVAGDIKTTWSFSAFTVLIYYAITNLAAIAMPKEDRLYPPLVPWAGLCGCLGLAFWVEPRVWISGLAVLLAGLVWHRWRRRSGSASP